MADLRGLVTELGYGDARTLLNSGNIVLTATATDSDKIAERLEEALPRRLGVSCRVTVLTAAELADVVTGNPAGDRVEDPSRMFVAFLRKPADRARLDPLEDGDWAPETLSVSERVAYVWCPDGILASRLFAAVGRALGDGVTTRNWATVRKLHALTSG